MSYISTLNKQECTGCRACEQICPKKCIKMIEDNEGYKYPVKEEKDCIDCGLCEKICPLNKDKLIKEFKQEVYVAKTRNEKALKNSSSGGMFWILAEECCRENGIIFGAKYDDNFNVVHDYVSDISMASIFRKSKYVQSDIKDSYTNTKKFLIEGKNVLFTGTPCQIAGLKSYLQKEYENLLCVDLICHGVPSQKIFNKYINFIENKYKSEVKRINFREKTFKNKKWNSKNMKIELTNSKIIIEDSIKNLYLRGYQGELYFRPSCEKCLFATKNRISDITIADCWGISNMYPDKDVHRGESMVVVNSEKGKKVFDNVKEKIDFKELTLEFAIESNAQFSHPTKFHPNRRYFFENLDKIRFDKLINKCIPQNKFKTIISKIFLNKVKIKIKKILKR